MKTLGIDLAAQAKKTGVCVIDWETLSAELRMGTADDDALLRLHESADKTAIDCPFGWPDRFIDFVTQHRQGEPVAMRLPPPTNNGKTDFSSLRYRETDRFIKKELDLSPLSVATDRLGNTALRCAALLEKMHVTDRSGQTGKVLEAYPAAAIEAWDPRSKDKRLHRGYKGYSRNAPKNRERLVAVLFDAVSLDVDRFELERSDDLLDAFICALVARAAALGFLRPVPAGLQSQAKREGWIRVPTPSSLRQLARPAAKKDRPERSVELRQPDHRVEASQEL